MEEAERKAGLFCCDSWSDSDRLPDLSVFSDKRAGVYGPGKLQPRAVPGIFVWHRFHGPGYFCDGLAWRAGVAVYWDCGCRGFGCAGRCDWGSERPCAGNGGFLDNAPDGYPAQRAAASGCSFCTGSLGKGGCSQPFCGNRTDRLDGNGKNYTHESAPAAQLRIRGSGKVHGRRIFLYPVETSGAEPGFPGFFYGRYECPQCHAV